MREVVDAASAVTDRTVPVRHAGRRPGDPAILVADTHRAAAALGWTPRHPDINDHIRHAARWMARKAEQEQHSQL